MKAKRMSDMAGLLLVFGTVHLLIARYEEALETGTKVYLPLAPRDPRSLIQGDYMQLDYSLSQSLDLPAGEWPRSGKLVLRLDDRGVGKLQGVYDGSSPLASDEVLINFRRQRRRLKIGAESFFFEEGAADRYAEARYAVLHVTDTGMTVLSDLADVFLVPISNQK